jgi:curved DNA-binding protein CbpA
MAMALHPDKCKLEGAAAAFQRLKRAYDHLTAITPN